MVKKSDYLGGFYKPPGKDNYGLNECICGFVAVTKK